MRAERKSKAITPMVQREPARGLDKSRPDDQIGGGSYERLKRHYHTIRQLSKKLAVVTKLSRPLISLDLVSTKFYCFRARVL